MLPLLPLLQNSLAVRSYIWEMGNIVKNVSLIRDNLNLSLLFLPHYSNH